MIRQFTINYYYINIPHIIALSKSFNTNREDKDIINKFYNFIFNLKTINKNISKYLNNADILDEYIFGIYANLWIFCDILDYNSISVPSTPTDKPRSYKDQTLDMLSSINPERTTSKKPETIRIKSERRTSKKPETRRTKSERTISMKPQNNKINILNSNENFEYIKQMLSQLYRYKYPQITTFTDLKTLWTFYIREIIIRSFNKLIFTNDTTNNIIIENYHYNKELHDNFLRINTDRRTDIYQSPFENFDKSITYDNIFNFYQTCYNNFYYNNDEFIINALSNKIIQYIKSLIVYSISRDDANIDEYKQRFITIPQYHKICWFISTMTGICYSNLHKRILLKKTRPDNNYSNFIYKIIDTISSCKLTHKQLLEDCDNKEVYELLHSFKNEPLEIIKSSFFEYIKTEKNRNINELANKVLKYLNNDDNSFNFDYNFELLVDILKNYGKITNTTEQSKIKLIIGSLDITDFDNEYGFAGNFNDYRLGISPYHYYSIFKHIYFQINLTITYLKIKKDENNEISTIYTIPDDLYYDKETKTEQPEIPEANDILILTEYFYDTEQEYMNKYTTNTNKILSYNNEKSVKYNGEIYVLDYILLHSDYTINSAITGHVISGVEINNEKYIYDSSFNITRYNNNEDIDVNCSFSKNNWNSNIFKNNKSTCIYYNYLCNYLEDKNNDLNVLRHLPYNDRMCYDNDKTHYIYVKQSLI